MSSQPLSPLQQAEYDRLCQLFQAQTDVSFRDTSVRFAKLAMMGFIEMDSASPYHLYQTYVHHLLSAQNMYIMSIRLKQQSRPAPAPVPPTTTVSSLPNMVQPLT